MKKYRYTLAAVLWAVGLFGYAWAQGNLPVQPYAPELFSPRQSGAVCGFSVTGDTIYFVREDTLQQRLVLHQAVRAGARWTAAKPLPFSGPFNDMGARLTTDRKRLYFSSDRPGGSTRAEDVWNLWYADRTATGWSEPVPLAALNNLGDECCPLPWGDALLFSAAREGQPAWWISSWREREMTEAVVPGLNQPRAWQWPSAFSRDGRLLLLNSMGRGDRALQDDIFVTWRTADGFSTPINLGAPVNTTAYEDGAILSPDQAWLIFCRHDTAQTPSQVLCIPWKPLLETLVKRN